MSLNGTSSCRRRSSFIRTDAYLRALLLRSFGIRRYLSNERPAATNIFLPLIHSPKSLYSLAYSRPFRRVLMNRSPLYCFSIPFISVLAMSTGVLGQETFSFRQAVDLALTQSNEIALSQADEARSYQTYLEAHSSYIPKVSVGSDVGYAYGFPLSLEGSAPTLFNVAAQSAVWNPALREFTKAAKMEWSASKTQTRDQRSRVIADTALAYIELNR